MPTGIHLCNFFGCLISPLLPKETFLFLEKEGEKLISKLGWYTFVHVEGSGFITII